MDDKLLEIPIRDWYGLHDGYRLPIWPGWTPVVGPNGAGKSTLLRQVGEWCRKNKVDAWSYSNQRDGGQTGRSAMGLRGDLAGLTTAVTSSEGEELAIHLGRAMQDLGRNVARAIREGRPLVVLLDGLDSGASEDRIAELASLLDYVEQDEIEKHDAGVYVLVAVNQYGMVRGGRDCLNPRTGRYLRFGSYDEYVGWVVEYAAEMHEDEKTEENRENENQGNHPGGHRRSGARPRRKQS